MAKPNRLGWLTSCSITPKVDVFETTDYRDGLRTYLTGLTTVEADLHVVAQDAGALMQQFHRWMNEGLTEPSYQSEYMCLYCGSPNSVEHTHCKKCGAPRSFVIG
jgi:hypothetical protein